MTTEVKETEVTPATPATEETEQTGAFMSFLKGIIGNGSKEEQKTAEGDDPKKDDLAKPEVKEDESKTAFTAEDVQKMIEDDRKKREDEAAEAKRMEKMSPEERDKEELKKVQERVNQLEKEGLTKDLRQSAMDVLTKDGYPIALANCIDFEKFKDNDEMQKTLTSVIDAFQEAMKAAIMDKLKIDTPMGLNNQVAPNTYLNQVKQSVKGGN